MIVKQMVMRIITLWLRMIYIKMIVTQMVMRMLILETVMRRIQNFVHVNMCTSLTCKIL